MYNNNTINGFLRENNLLTLESQMIDCNIKTIIELQFENKILSSENGNIVMVTSRRNTNNLQLSFFSLSHLSNMHNGIGSVQYLACEKSHIIEINLTYFKGK